MSNAGTVQNNVFRCVSFYNQESIGNRLLCVLLLIFNNDYVFIFVSQIGSRQSATSAAVMEPTSPSINGAA